MDKISQKNQVWEYLLNHDSINKNIAREQFNCNNLSKIIYELKSEGKTISIRNKIIDSFDNGSQIKMNEYFIDRDATPNYLVYKKYNSEKFIETSLNKEMLIKDKLNEINSYFSIIYKNKTYKIINSKVNNYDITITIKRHLKKIELKYVEFHEFKIVKNKLMEI